ncbi:MAG: Membrane protein [Homoserinimonas sp.]|nr:Membrane protein [Homoserinimonas sp.]
MALTLVIPASLLVFLPINFFVGVATATVLYLGCAALFLITAPTISVTRTHLVAGRARLPLDAVGEVSIFEDEEAVLERGQRLDARAWLLIRGWVSPVVKVTLQDPVDPTPYWLVSSRRPAQLADAILNARAKEKGTAD